MAEAASMTSVFLRKAHEGNISEVENMLNEGVPVDSSQQTGLQAIHFAARNGHLDLMEILLKRGADVNASTNRGNTPIHVGSLQGYTDIVKLLLKNGANVNAQSECGAEEVFTPLYMAAQIGHQEIVMLLLMHGADPTIKTKNNCTPYDVAVQQQHKVVAELLKEYEKRLRGEIDPDDSELDKELEAIEGAASADNGSPNKAKMKNRLPPVYNDVIPSPRSSPRKMKPYKNGTEGET